MAFLTISSVSSVWKRNWKNEIGHSCGGESTISSRKGAKFERRCDWWLYKERHLAERYFLRLKAFRRIATRYDKKMFTAFLFWVLIVLSPKHIRFNGVPPAGSQQADSPHADSGYAAFVFPQPHSAAAHSVRPTRLWIFAFSPVLPPLSRASRKRT